MSFECGDIGVGFHLPQLDRIIRREVDNRIPCPGGEYFSIGRKRHRPDSIHMPSKGGDIGMRCHGPQLDRFILCSGS